MQEDRLVHAYRETIEAAIARDYRIEYVTGCRDMRLRCLMPVKRGAQAALLILGGRTEFIEKYNELIFDLQEPGIAIFSYEHRGQGLSQRLLADGEKGHVERFDDYVEDLKIVLDQLVGRQFDRVIVLAHSMGGAVVTLYQIRYPGTLSGIILSSPMLGINCFPVPVWFTSWLTRWAIGCGHGERYIPGGGPFRDSSPFFGNVLTSSRVRFLLNQELVRRLPGVALGSPTNRWLREALMAAARAVDEASRLDVPVLLLQSGNDRVVTAAAQNVLCGRARQCRLEVVKGARHELLMERDGLRDQALRHIRDFMGQLEGGDTKATRSGCCRIR